MILGWIANYAEVNLNLTGKVWADVIPEKVKLPYVLLEHSASTPFILTRGQSPRAYKATITFSVFGVSCEQVEELMDQIEDAFFPGPEVDVVEFHHVSTYFLNRTSEAVLEHRIWRGVLTLDYVLEK